MRHEKDAVTEQQDRDEGRFYRRPGTMMDASVGTGWVCQERRLDQVLVPVQLANKDDDTDEFGQWDETNWAGPVLLERLEDGSPCVLALRCGPASSAAVVRLLVVSEARTMEVYERTGQYCGTGRGAEDGVQPEGSDRGPFYRKHLTLDHPSSACEVKLLSLAGRSSVQVCRIVVGFQSQRPSPDRGPGIDLQQVQCLVQEMGTSLSPAAQNLMDMVQFQQKNQSSSLGGFLPLLMGSGAFSALNRVQPADQTPPFQDEGTSEDSTSPSPASSDDTSTTSSEGGGPMSHAHLAEMMSRFLNGQGGGQAASPELLPMLQSVCGQVTQLRLDNAAAEKQRKMSNETWEVDLAMERRLEEMEKRLKEHVDRRLDALEQKLEKVLLSALPLAVLNHGAASPSAVGPPEPVTQTH